MHDVCFKIQKDDSGVKRPMPPTVLNIYKKNNSKSDTSSLKSKIKRNISELIDGELLKPFFHELQNILKDEKGLLCNTVEEGVKILMNQYVLDNIIIITKAMHSCLDDLKKTGAQEPLISDMLNGGASVIGWLVLLAIKSDWMNDYQNESNRDKPIRVEIPVQNEMALEIVFSGLNESQAKFERRKCFNTGTGAILAGGKMELDCKIEDGFAISCEQAVKQVKQKIYTFVNKRPVPGHMTIKDEKTLNTRLYLKERKDHYHYMTVNVEDVAEPLNRHDVYDEIIKDLPALKELIVFYRLTEDETIFRVVEKKLIVLIEAYFTATDHYSKILHGTTDDEIN